MSNPERRSTSQWVRLQYKPLDVPAANSFLQAPEVGGIALFIGTTRKWTGRRETVRLEYEAYEEMALKEMQQLAEQAASEWPALHRVCIVHRLGTVPPEQASVLCGAASPHRAASFEACRWLIDHLKEQVPIWKREVYADGETEWVGVSSTNVSSGDTNQR